MMAPQIAKAKWPKDLIDEALRSFIFKLLKKPLPDNIDNFAGYISRAFRNHCFDMHKARRSKKTISVEDTPDGWEPVDKITPSALVVALQRERSKKLHTAISKLDIADRIVLKLANAPEWLDEKEVLWLADRSNMTITEARLALSEADDMYAMSRVFDPGDDDPKDKAKRRTRMERFRKRRARARKKLRDLLQEVK